MLKSMRKHAKYYYIFFFLIIITFVFWGVGPVNKNRPSFVAKIGSQLITANEYWETYRRMGETYRQMYKDQPFDEVDKKLNLKQLVLDTIIEERVLLQSAKDLGITVTDAELQEAIIKNPAFRRNGVFKREIYMRTMELNRLTPEAFEAMLRDQIAILKMRRMISSSLSLTDIDLKVLPRDAAKADLLKELLLQVKQDTAVKSYLEAARLRYKVTVNKEALV